MVSGGGGWTLDAEGGADAVLIGAQWAALTPLAGLVPVVAAFTHLAWDVKEK